MGVIRCKRAAVALEFVHTYSLVHDDLPALDNDDLRRGKPTTHKVFGEDFAILIGDALLTEAFGLITSSVTLSPLVRLEMVNQLSQDAGAQGMVLGQWLDVENTKAESGTWNTLKCIHQQKTGKLFAASLSIGVLAGWNSVQSKSVVLARKLGITLGLAFQIVDDILDVTASSQLLGKTARKDIDSSKLTAVSLLGLHDAKVLAEKLTNESIALFSSLKLECAQYRVSLKESFQENAAQNYNYKSFETLTEALILSLLKRTN
jgi:geranylgeranyl pyrophosphate synthase